MACSSLFAVCESGGRVGRLIAADTRSSHHPSSCTDPERLTAYIIVTRWQVERDIQQPPNAQKVRKVHWRVRLSGRELRSTLTSAASTSCRKYMYMYGSHVCMICITLLCDCFVRLQYSSVVLLMGRISLHDVQPNIHANSLVPSSSMPPAFGGCPSAFLSRSCFNVSSAPGINRKPPLGAWT